MAPGRKPALPSTLATTGQLLQSHTGHDSAIYFWSQTNYNTVLQRNEASIKRHRMPLLHQWTPDNDNIVGYYNMQPLI